MPCTTKQVVLTLLLASTLEASMATGGEAAIGVSRQMVRTAMLPNIPGHKLTAVSVELAPGVRVPSHVHDGFVFVYVLEGSVRSQLGEAEVVEYKAGDSWVEPPGNAHTLTHNPSLTDVARILAVFVAKEDAQLTTSGEISR